MVHVIELTFLIVVFVSTYGILSFSKIDERKWRIGMFGGLACTGAAMLGIVAPKVNAYPFLSFLLGQAFMLVMGLIHYYNKPLPSTLKPEEVLASESKRMGTVAKLSAIFAVGMIVVAIIAYTSSQNSSIKVNSSLESAVVQLNEEIASVRAEMQAMRKDFKVLNGKVDKKIAVDSLRYQKTKADASNRDSKSK